MRILLVALVVVFVGLCGAGVWDPAEVEGDEPEQEVVVSPRLVPTDRPPAVEVIEPTVARMTAAPSAIADTPH